MSQTSVLVDVLKGRLRREGFSYADVARRLKLSESSIKRLFAQKNFTLSRLEEICALMAIDVADLCEMARSSEAKLTELTEQQERELVAEPKLLLIGILAINHWSAAAMHETYRVSQAEVLRLLLKLDRIGIVDLLPDNRIKVRLARNFAWRRAGPVQRFFEARVQQQFFASSFAGAEELRLMVHGSLSARSNALLQQRLRRLAEDFDALVHDDQHLALDQRQGTTLVMAVRPWELALFTPLRRTREGDRDG